MSMTGPDEHVPLAPHTTLGLGGPARWFWAVTSGEMLIEALRWAGDAAVPLWVLGGGSNVIVPDQGLDGLVVKMALPGVRIDPAAADGTVLVHVGAGESWDALVSAVVAAGLQGLECLSGIPGYAGATPIQNVGAYGQEVADTIIAVHGVDRATLAPVGFAAAECAFGYRASRFKAADRDRFIVTEVTFRLRIHGPPALRYPELRRAVEALPGYSSLPQADALHAVRAAVLALRRRKSMVVDAADPNSRSVGSFFMNPVLDDAAVERLRRRWCTSADSGDIPVFPAGGGRTKVSAAWLVEQAGFPRGTRRRGVGVSPNHALALVNLGGTSAELLALALEIRTAVEARFGVVLEREPVVLGTG
jgi:UDP-N-acetylmuramate dehydrogenase